MFQALLQIFSRVPGMRGPSQGSGVPQGKRDLIYPLHLDYVFIAAAGQLIYVIHLYNFTEYYKVYNFIVVLFQACFIATLAGVLKEGVRSTYFFQV